jgi:hypothetical protein
VSRTRSRLTATAVKRYIDGAGGHCPRCGSTDVEPGRTHARRGRATVDVECFACHARWRDVYDLSAVEAFDANGRSGPAPAAADSPPHAPPCLDQLLDSLRTVGAPGSADGSADLARALVRAAWRLMTPAQRMALAQECALAAMAAPPVGGPPARPAARRH